MQWGWFCWGFGQSVRNKSWCTPQQQWCCPSLPKVVICVLWPTLLLQDLHRASQQTGSTAGALRCLSSPLSTSQSTPWSHLEDQRPTSCMLINVQLTLIWKLTMYFSPFSQAEGQALLAARLVHIQNISVEATGGLIHGFTDSLLWPCREPSVVQNPGVAVLELSPNSGAFPRCLEHPTVGTNTTRLCQDPGWCCSSTGQGSPHSAHDFPNSISSLPCPQGKSPWVRGDSSSFPVVLKENQFLHFWFLLFTCLINYTT